MWLIILTVTFAPIYTQPVKYSTYQYATDSKESCYEMALSVNNNFMVIEPTWPGAVSAKCKML